MFINLKSQLDNTQKQTPPKLTDGACFVGPDWGYSSLIGIASNDFLMDGFTRGSSRSNVPSGA